MVIPKMTKPTSRMAKFYSDLKLRKVKLQSRAVIIDAIRWDEKAGLRRDAVRSQVIDVL